MPEGLWPILVMNAAVIVYAIAKVIGYMRKSEKQWAYKTNKHRFALRPAALERSSVHFSPRAPGVFPK